MITYCISHEILYESVPYHNAVFVGKDESGKARYAFLRGIYEKNGKDSRWSRPGVKKSTAFVFHLKEKQNELSYMKRVLMHWPT
ncbi:DUF3991 domain-containing protein [Roseburia inulinivorans]|uniref:DUF3991 domain-containing protein n=1 Tax=Roseburia inulinivorans TaxID=360807 RepID=UPI002E8E579B|nr:DUF3991 domain-containing protein [Roseburia inulinivorans]